MNAVVLQMPNAAQRRAKLRMDRTDIEGRYRWMKENRDKWEVTEVNGFEPEEYIEPRVRQLVNILDKVWGPVPKPTVAEMKKEIAKGRKIIEERNRIKAWLAVRGVDLGTISSAEEALSCMFSLVRVCS